MLLEYERMTEMVPMCLEPTGFLSLRWVTQLWAGAPRNTQHWLLFLYWEFPYPSSHYLLFPACIQNHSCSVCQRPVMAVKSHQLRHWKGIQNKPDIPAKNQPIKYHHCSKLYANEFVKIDPREEHWDYLKEHTFKGYFQWYQFNVFAYKQ